MAPNPLLRPVFFDSCAHDGGDKIEQAASNKARELFEQHGRKINILHSVEKEINHPATPQWIKDLSRQTCHTIEMPLNDQEQETLRAIELIITGDGNLEKRRVDCRHVFEAQKYGAYFVTTDKDILKHCDTIKKRFTVPIVMPSQFLEIVKQYVVKSPDELFERLDTDTNVDGIRRDIADLIAKYLIRSKETFDYWTKAHLTYAIAWLAVNVNVDRPRDSTSWLRLCLVNACKSQVPSNERSDDYTVRDKKIEALTFEQLMDDIRALGGNVYV